MSLGTNGSKGIFFLACDADIWEFLTVTHDGQGGNVQIAADAGNLTHWGVSAAMTSIWISAAILAVTFKQG